MCFTKIDKAWSQHIWTSLAIRAVDNAFELIFATLQRQKARANPLRIYTPPSQDEIIRRLIETTDAQLQRSDILLRHYNTDYNQNIELPETPALDELKKMTLPNIAYYANVIANGLRQPNHNRSLALNLP